MQFVLPSKYTPETVPLPTDPLVTVKQVKSRSLGLGRMVWQVPGKTGGGTGGHGYQFVTPLVSVGGGTVPVLRSLLCSLYCAHYCTLYCIHYCILDTAFITVLCTVDYCVTAEQVPGKKVGVMVFSGRWTEDQIAAKAEALKGHLEGAGHTVKGNYLTAFYNSPFTIPFFRRNEIWFELES